MNMLYTLSGFFILYINTCKGDFWSGLGIALDKINPVAIVQRTIDDDGKTLMNALDTINPVAVVQRTIDDDGKTLLNVLDTINPVAVAKRTVNDRAETLGRVSLGIGESLPLVGHVIAGVQAIRGDDYAAKRALYSANSVSAAIAGGAVGTLCGPAAPACVPTLAVLSQTAMDGLNSHIENKPMGNVEYFTNFENKTGLEHAAFVGGIAVDSITAGLGGRAMKSTTKPNKQIVDIPTGHKDVIEQVKMPIKVENTRPVVKNSDNVSQLNQKLGNSKDASDKIPNIVQRDADVVDDVLHNEYNYNEYKRQLDVSFENYKLHEILESENQIVKLDKTTGKSLTVENHNLDVHTKYEGYAGPFTYYHDNYEKLRDAVLKTITTTQTYATGEAAKLLNQYKNLILTDPRSMKYPEINTLSTEQISLIKPRDLRSLNLGTTRTERITNCARLSVEEAFGVPYSVSDKQIHKSLVYDKINQILDTPYHTTTSEVRNIIMSSNVPFTTLRPTGTPKDSLNRFLSELKYVHTNGIAIITTPQIKTRVVTKTKNHVQVQVLETVEEVNGHAVVFEAVRKPDGQVISVIKDFQVDESITARATNYDNNGILVDSKVFGTKFTDFDDKIYATSTFTLMINGAKTA